MAEIKISDLTPKGANLIATDLLVISEDIGGGLYETKSITGDEVLNAVAKTAVAVRNQTGATIYKGTIVYISGASGGKALISKAQANSEATSSKTLGVVTADIANNANGNVLTNGLLTLLDTRTTATHPFTADTLTIGDDLYLSPTNAGYVTNVKPIAPNNLVNIGKVLETSSTTGQILYAIVNGYELGELHDVDTTGAVTGNVLALDGSVWKPTTISSGITIGTTPITSGVAGRVLFEGAGNVMQEDSAFFWDNTNKRLGIGATPATNARLDIRAQGALSTDLVLRARNSSDTRDIVNIRGNKTIELLADTPATNGGLSITASPYNEPILNFYDNFGSKKLIIDSANYLIGVGGSGNVKIGSLTTNNSYLGLVTPSTNNRFLKLVDAFDTEYLSLGGNAYDGGGGISLTLKTTTNNNSTFVTFSKSNNTNKVVITDQANMGIGQDTFGDSSKFVLAIANGTAPTTSPANCGQIYVEGGALKYRGSSGTITVLGVA